MLHEDTDPRSGFAATLAESGLPVLARAVATGAVGGPGVRAVLEALAGLAGDGYADADLATAEEFLTTIVAGADPAEVDAVVREHCEQILRPELEDDEADAWDEVADLSGAEDLTSVDAPADLPVVGLYAEDDAGPAATTGDAAKVGTAVSVPTRERMLDRKRAGPPGHDDRRRHDRRRCSSGRRPVRPGAPHSSITTGAHSRRVSTAPHRSGSVLPAPSPATSRRTTPGRAPPAVPLPTPGGPGPPPT